MDRTLPLPNSKEIRNQVQFRDILNPRLWTGNRLRPEVRLKLFQSAMAFYRFLAIPSLIVKDIVLTGSNAAYNYTVHSDIDVHLLVNISGSDCPDLASNFFNTKKALWSRTFDVNIRHHPLEFYVEDTATPVIANGVFSILHNKWLKVPDRTPPHTDDFALEHKVDALITDINTLLDSEPSIVDLDKMLQKLYDLRQNGLMHGGEFSIENLAFKVLRSLNYIQKLYDKRTDIRDKELSLT